MQAPVQKGKRYTIAEYLAMEELAVERHEFHDGEILAMSGGTLEHSAIAANIIRELGYALKEKPCRVFTSDLRVWIAGAATYVYPDVSVICRQPQHDPNDPRGQGVTNPRLIVEVLSESTEAYDRGDKFRRYLELESLREYMLVSQTSPRVELYSRQEDGAWLFRHFSGLQEQVTLRSLEMSIELAEIYRGVEFAAPRE